MPNPSLTPTIDVRWLPTTYDGDDAGLDRLDARERDRRSRFVFAADRRAYTAAHALLRDLLSEMAPLPPVDWRFAVGPRGKPHLAGEHAAYGLSFNLSHSRGLVACAVSRGPAVGVDVEVRGVSVDVDELAASVLSESERAALAASPDREATFLSFWTLREAYAKARGLGLSLPFRDYQTALAPPRVIPSADDPSSWSAWLERPEGSFLAVVAEGAPTVRIRRAEPEWLP